MPADPSTKNTIVIQPVTAGYSASLLDYRDFDFYFSQHRRHTAQREGKVLLLQVDHAVAFLGRADGDGGDEGAGAMVVRVDAVTWASCRGVLTRHVREVGDEAEGTMAPVIPQQSVTGSAAVVLRDDGGGGVGERKSVLSVVPVLQRAVLMPLCEVGAEDGGDHVRRMGLTVVNRDGLVVVGKVIYYVVDCANVTTGLVDDEATELVVLHGEERMVHALRRRFRLGKYFSGEGAMEQSLADPVEHVLAYSAFLSDSKPAPWKCKLRIMDIPPDHSVVDGIDAKHVVLLTQQQLRRQKLFSGSWCWLSSNAHSERKRLVYVKECELHDSMMDVEEENDQSSSSILVTRHLFFQLMKSDYFHHIGYEAKGNDDTDENGEDDGHAKIDAILERVNLGVDGDIADREMPRVASKVILVPITTPNRFTLDENQCPDSAIKTFFSSCKRILCEGDIIAIPHSSNKYNEMEEVDGLYTQWQLQKLDLLRPMLSYFAVASIEDGETIDAEQTQLITSTGQEIQSYVPPPVSPTAFERHDMDGARVLASGATYEALDALFAACVYESYGTHDRGEKRHHSIPALVPSILLYGNKGTGKQHTVSMLSIKYGMHLLDVSCYELLGEQDQQTQEHLSQIFAVADQCRPCVMLWRNFEALAQEDTTLPSHMKASKIRLVHAIEQHLEDLGKSTSPLPVLFLCSTNSNSLDHLMPIFRQKIFMEKLKFATNMDIPQWRELMLSSRKKNGIDAMDISLEWMESEMGIGNGHSSVSFGDAHRLQQHATSHALFRTVSSNSIRQREDYEYSMKRLHEKRSKMIGAPEVPHVTWGDVGGLEEAKQEVLDTIQLPLLQPELFEGRNRRQRSGILLYGPPGTGKTLLAKAVATECSLNFMSVKGPELLNMYIGESEKNIREVFERARESAPCVIFFDELDALAPNRGVSGDSGGVMDRITSQLLAELDGLHSSRSVFVIGATNRPDLLDSALLRPGRFDRMVYLGISGNKGDQYKIIKALSRKFVFEVDEEDENEVATETAHNKEGDLDAIVDEALHGVEDGPSMTKKERMLRSIAEKCPMNFTGADFYALCSDAFMKALMEIIGQGGDELLANSYDDGRDDVAAMPVVRVSERHFVEALQHITPSISEQELQRYKALQESFKK